MQLRSGCPELVFEGSHQLAEHGLVVLDGGLAGVARGAGVGGGGLGQEVQILLLELFQLGGDAHVHGELTDGVDGSLAVGGLMPCF